MSVNLSVILQPRPGTMAEALEAIAQANINLEGACAIEREGRGILHLLVRDEDANAAHQAIEEVGLEIQDQSNVVVTDLEDKPGAAARLFRRIAEAGVNCNLMYLATNTRVVVGADDLYKVKSSLA